MGAPEREYRSIAGLPVRAYGVALLALWLAACFAAPIARAASDDDGWRKELERDFRNIERARSNQAILHRGLVEKWRDSGHLDDVVREYETRAQASPNEPPLTYGLGYAYAVREGAGDLERAVIQFRRATELDPSFALAYYSLGGVLYRLGRTEEALAAYTACVRVAPAFVPAHYAMGEVYRETGDATSALAAYDLALERAKSDWARPHVGKGLVFTLQDKDAEAEQEFRRALELDPKLAAAYFALGQLWARAGRDTEALDLYRSGAQYGGYEPDSLQALGRIFARRGKPTLAEEQFRHAIQLRADDASLHFDLAEALWAQGRHDEAVPEYRAANALDAQYTTFFTDRVKDAFFAAKMTATEARGLLDKALAVDAEDVEALLLYAQVETAANDLDAAIRRYEAVEAIQPDRADLYFPLGDLYFARGRMDEARAAYRRAAELNPTQRNRFAAEGRQAFDAERFADAISAYRKHLLIDPDDVDARYRLARSFESAGRPTEAISEYERIRAAFPETKDALVRLARLYHARKSDDRALEVLAQLVSLQPENVDGHFTRGEILRARGENAAAIAAFEQAVKLDTTHAEAYAQLARLYESSDAEAAIGAYRRVIELAPDRPTPYFRLGALLIDRGEGDEAIPLYTKGLELEPRRAKEHYTLARLLDERDRLSEALPHYAAAVDGKADEPAWQFDYARCADRLASEAPSGEDVKALVETADRAYTAAITLRETGDAFYYRGRLRRTYKQIGGTLYLSSEIAEDFNSALRLDPKNADAHYWLGMTYLDMESDDLAKATFQRLAMAHPTYPGVNAELGALAEASQDYKGAMEYYRRELKANPKSARAHYRLGYLYANAIGDPATGAEHLEQAIRLDPTDAEVFVEYGRALYQMDRIRAAADQFERAVKLDPENLTANFNLALMYQYLDKRELAIQRWKYLLSLDKLPGEWKAEARAYIEQLMP